MLRAAVSRSSLFCLAFAAAAAVGVNALAQAPVPDLTGNLARVNTMQGTNSLRDFSHGNVLPSVGPPSAMTDWCIQNNPGMMERWFYHAKMTTFVGLRATHQPCPWAGDYGAFVLTPQSGDVALDSAMMTAVNAESTRREGGRAGPVCTYDPTTTVQRPDYLRVRLDAYKVTAELTSSDRGAVMRLTFDPGVKTGRVLVHIYGDAQLLAGGTGFSGYSKVSGKPTGGDYRCYIVGNVDRPITKAGPIGSETEDGKGIGYIEFDVSDGKPVEIQMATSFISKDQGTQNLKELAGGFEATRQRTVSAWEKIFSRMDVKGADERLNTFYTCLWRVFKYPSKLHEVTADGKVVHKSPWNGEVMPGPAYTNSGLWDTYRTQFPFFSFAYPDHFSEIMEGWINAYKDAGWIPHWPSPGGIRGMPGSHADVMVADAMVKGIKGFDYETAYAAIRKDAFDVPEQPRRGQAQGGRGGMAEYLKLGYIPKDAHEYWVSSTLDYAYDDWCVAQAAKLLGKTADYEQLMRRSQNYKNLWDPTVGFMRSKDAHGNWTEKNFDEFYWGGPYTESGPWQASWAVQHDADGLADLLGGREAFVAKLDKLFSMESTFHTGGYGQVIHEMTEFVACKMGQYAGCNQPSFHIPYFYAALGQPWKTEYWSRRACKELFNAGIDGYSGDEDNGSNSAWYLLSAIGIYPLTPGHPTYVLTSPEFESVKIHLPNGKTLTISSEGGVAEKMYVSSRTINGKVSTSTWVSHEDLANGATIINQMSDKPAERKVAEADLPYSAKADVAKLPAPARSK